MRKTGELLADDYAAACQRVEDAAAAITIPDHLLTFDPDDWTSGPRGQTEQHRLAQEAWYSVRRLGWDEFLELQARQKARQATGPKGGRRRARARSTGR